MPWRCGRTRRRPASKTAAGTVPSGGIPAFAGTTRLFTRSPSTNCRAGRVCRPAGGARCRWRGLRPPGCSAEYRALKRAKHRQVRRPQSPSRVGMSAKRARAGAGNIHQDKIDGPDGGKPRIGDVGKDVRDLQPAGVADDAPQTAERDVTRIHARRIARELDRLPAWRGAEIGGNGTRRHAGVLRNEGGAGIL